MPVGVVGGEILTNAARNCRPCSRSLTQLPKRKRIRREKRQERQAWKGVVSLPHAAAHSTVNRHLQSRRRGASGGLLTRCVLDRDVGVVDRKRRKAGGHGGDQISATDLGIPPSGLVLPAVAGKNDAGCITGQRARSSA